MSTSGSWRRWSALPTVLALIIAVGLTACNDASSGPLGVDSQLTPAVSTPLFSHTPAATDVEYDLIAGQNIDVGDVTIADDGTDLIVHIDMNEGWCLTEVHIAAADGEPYIPQNNSGNPQPGQFDKWEPGDDWTGISDTPDCVTGDNYWEFPLPPDTDEDGNDGIVVAVHTVVLGPEQTMSLYADGSESFLANTGPGTAAFTGECSNLTADRAGTAVLAWEPPANSDPSLWDSETDHTFSSSADWIWESFRVQNPVCGDVVKFTRGFDVPGVPTGGTLWSTADNGHEAWVNGTMTASNGLAGAWKASDLGASFVLVQGWQDVQESDLAGLLSSGSNQFVFWAANEYMNADDADDSSAGTISSNPGGLIYEASITYRAPEETAWCDGTEFEFDGRGKARGGGNWGMYCDYTPREDTCEEQDTFYGTDLGTGATGDRIFRINPPDLEAGFIFDTDLSDGELNYPNGNAFDEAGNRLFYADGGDLYIYDFAAGTQAGSLGDLTGGPELASGTWDAVNGEYLYVPQGTDDLWSATYDGSFSKSLVQADFTGMGLSFGFGDLIVVGGTTIYGSTNSPDRFWSMNLDGSGWTLICDGDPDPGNAGDCPGHLQLAVGSGGEVFGHHAGTGMFYEIDLATATTSEIGTITEEGGSNTLKFTDFASGPQECVISD